MIDPQLLHVNDVFIFIVHPRDGSQVITGNVLRDRRRLLQSPAIVRIHDRWPELDRADEHLVDSMLGALPMIPGHLLLEAIVVNGPDGNPLKSVGDGIDGDPIARLTGRQRVYCLNPAPGIWEGITEARFRVVDKATARRRRGKANPPPAVQRARLAASGRSTESEAPTIVEPDPDSVPTELSQPRRLMPIRPVTMDLKPIPSIFGGTEKP